MSVAEAARRHGVTATTISNWRDRFIEVGKGGLENKISGPAHGGTVAERRLRSENEQLKLALAEQMVQLRLWQKGAEHIEDVPSVTSKPESGTPDAGFEVLPPGRYSRTHLPPASGSASGW
jgi:transposase